MSSKSSESRSEAEFALEILEKKLSDEMQRRRSRRLPPQDQRHSYLQIEVYREVRLLLRKRNDYSAVKRRFPLDAPRQPPIETNPFRWALASLREEGLLISAANVFKFGRNMHYAHLHEIEPEWLTGFIYQVGGSAVISYKWKRREMETWYTKEYKKNLSEVDDWDM